MSYPLQYYTHTFLMRILLFDFSYIPNAVVWSCPATFTPHNFPLAGCRPVLLVSCLSPSMANHNVDHVVYMSCSCNYNMHTVRNECRKSKRLYVHNTVTCSYPCSRWFGAKSRVAEDEQRVTRIRS